MKPKSTSSIDVQVGARLRLRRTLVGLSQERLGEAIGVSFQQVQKYENGKNRISASRLQQIANVLGVAPDFFFPDGAAADAKQGTAPAPALADEIGMFLMSKEGLELNRAFLKIADAGVRRSIVALVRSLN